MADHNRALQNTVQAVKTSANTCRALPSSTEPSARTCAAAPRLHSHGQAWLAETQMHKETGSSYPKRGRPCSNRHTASGHQRPNSKGLIAPLTCENGQSQNVAVRYDVKDHQNNHPGHTRTLTRCNGKAPNALHISN